MKKILLPAIILINLIFAQSGATDIDKLLENYPQIESYRNNTSTSSYNYNQSGEIFDFTEYTNDELLTLDSLGVLWFLLDTTIVKDEIPYYGYEFFNNPDKIAIFDNIPIPNNYILGPGDQLVISIWGSTQMRTSHIINREGDIFVDGIGQINLSGLDIYSAEELLRDNFSSLYSTIKGKNPSTFLSLSIGQLKSINVSFVGEVGYPGIHAVHPFSDITLALLQVGGVDTVGSLRNIQVVRNGEQIFNFDFYDYLVGGMVSQNTRLINGDVILVPPRKSYVTIEGEVNRPGIYEARNSDSIYDILAYAGGITAKAQPNIELYELKSFNERYSEDYAYDVSYLSIEEVKERPAGQATKIRVLSVPDVEREVSIFGQVKLPGKYAFQDSMRLLDLLNIAGGLNDTSYRESMYTSEAEVIRQIKDNVYPKRMSINLDQLINGDENQNVLLNNKDIILIRENRKFSVPKYVTISGEINVPGKYTIQKKEESLNSIISRAGGFTKNAFENGLQMYRDSTQIVLKGYDIYVADGDSVYIPESPGVVTVEGQVNKTGLVQYVPGKSLNYYIERAGGYNNYADKKKVIVQYANGNVRKKKSFLISLLSITPPVKDGSTITVYTKEVGNPYNTIQLLSATASVASSIVTLYLLIQK